MPRIPEDQIERIKQETDLAALVRSRGIELAKHGGNGHLVGKCPFHPDKNNPNFIVTPAKGLYHCMACGAAGNAIQFVEKFDGVSFRHAFELLNDGPAAYSAPANHPNRWGTDEATRPMKRTRARRLENLFTPEAEDVELFGQVVDYYHERLLKTPQALDYLNSRGLYHDEAIERFRIGYADRTLGLRLPERKRKDGKAIRERLIKLGFLRESGHEHFNGSIVLPIFDNEGNLAEMYGRKTAKRVKRGKPHLYLPGPHAGIWNEDDMINDTGEVILCEAPLDALTFWVNGIRNVTFIYGTESFPKYLFDALLARRVKTVRLAYDADQAGDRAHIRDAQRLIDHGIECYRIRFPFGMDVNEYAQKVLPATKSLAMAVKAAEWAGPDTPTPLSAGGDAQAGTSARGRDISNNKLAAKKLVASHSLTRQGEYYTLTLGQREYRIGGLDRNNSLEVLKVAVRLRHDEDFHLDSLDMTRDNERRRFIERAAEETRLEKELIKRDLGKLLLAMEQTQQERLNAVSETTCENTPRLTAEEHEEALKFLKAPDLAKRITETFALSGLVGEGINSLAAYLSCTSRKLDKPLAVIIQSSTAAGKTALMESVLAMFPEEERVKYSAMTGQSLFYLGETDLKHKILAIVEEEGAEKAGYALKLLQSEGELTIASTGKNPQTGRMETQEYHVEGPVMIFLTTTAIEIDEELQNRCLMLTVDESREQTRRIHALQREGRTLEGLKRKKQRQSLLNLMRNAQRLLKPVEIMNPYCTDLTFTADKTRTRRDHEKYLALIDAIALLHQYQRKRHEFKTPAGEATEYISVTLDDIELANKLAPDLLGRSLDELPPQSRNLLDHIKALVSQRCKAEEIEQRVALFSRRQLCAASGWTYSQVKRHLARLQELEYIVPRYGRMGSAMQYELLIDANEPADTYHIGLLDVEKLRKSKTTAPTCTPSEGGWTPPCQNPMSKLNDGKSTTKDNLATLPDRTSGTLAVAES